MRKCDRLDVFHHFRSFKHVGIPFPVEGGIAEKTDVTTHFPVGGLVVQYAGIFHVSCSVQKLFKNFMLVQWLKFSFQFLGQIRPLKPSLQISRHPKGTSLRKSASILALLPFGL
jgi:hypothetical protein